MKKITVSMMAVLALNTCTFAGGNIAPVEPVVTESTSGSWYVGAGYSYVKWDDQQTGYTIEITGDAYTLLAGYEFNQYVAIEGRYTSTFGNLSWKESGRASESDDSFSNLALYVKPMYPVSDALKLYGLLGYGKTTFDFEGSNLSESDFQWGLGASYAINNNFSVFVDYTRWYDGYDFDNIGAQDLVIDSWNIGVTYSF